MTPPFPNSYWLEPGRIVCGEYPRDIDDSDNQEKMTALLEAGVRVFVDLTEENELKPYGGIALEAARRMGIGPDALEFHRHPIRDVSVPGAPELMCGILRTIRSARHRGRTLYVHCWGGRGRTGTVAGCVLREIGGHDGGSALSVLTERWQACAKSSKWGSPETAEQSTFVREWNRDVPTRLDRIRAAILGAAVGDALGVPVEFQGREARRADPVTGMREFGTHNQPAGTWSDDTSMILATIEGLVRAGRYDPESIMREFVQWVEHGRHTPHGVIFDMGIATSSAIRRCQSGIAAIECGGSTEMSNGNGSLMRIIPIALAFANDPDLIGKASEISSLTHAHERSRFCCAFYCLVASDLMHGGTIREASEFAWQIMDDRWDFTRQGERERFDALRPDRLFARKESEIASSGHVIDTLEASLWVIDRHDNYADAALHAVNLGGDTDTTGCVAGALAGLIHGEAGIPDEWLRVLVKRKDVENQCAGFAGFCETQTRALQESNGES